jgi:hypothetical protein
VNFAAGRYKIPEIVTPSALFHSTSSGGGSAVSGLKLTSLVVHRLSVLSDVSIE